MVTANPRAVWPARPLINVSSDGVLSALSDDRWAGVHLKASFATMQSEKFEGGVAAWVPYGGATIATETDSPLAGTTSLKATLVTGTSSGAQWNVPDVVPAGKTVTVQFSIRTDVAGAVRIAYNDGGSSWKILTFDRVPTPGVQTAYSDTAVVPSGRALSRFYVYQPSGGASAGDALVLDEVYLTISDGEVPEAVRFIRNWDGELVRGGDEAPVVSGQAYTYDHEALLGQTSSWYAVPLYADGSAGVPTAVVTKTLADPTGGASDPSTWIKSITDPEKSVRAMIDSWPSFSYDTMAEAQRPKGRENSIVTYDVLGGMTTEAKFRTMTKADYDLFFDMCKSGGPLLFQTAAKYNRPSFYAVCSSVVPEDQARYWDTQVTWTLQLTEIDRPAVVGMLPSTPGHTFADRLRNYPLFANVPPRTFGAARPF